MLPGARKARTADAHVARRAASAGGQLTGSAEAALQPAAAAPHHKSVLLRRTSSASSSEGSLTLDNKNPSKLVVKPDGNILWEMPAETKTGGPAAVGALLHGAAEMALVLAAMSSGVMGVAVAVTELMRASDGNYCVTSQHLAKLMASTVSSSFAGTVAGLAYAPLLAARLVCGRLARPAAVVGVAAAAARGVVRLVAIRGMSPGKMLRKLQEAALTFGGDCLEAAERVAARAAANPSWRRAFVKLGGVETLLKLLHNGLDADTARAVVQALAQLLKEAAAQQGLVAAGGVPYLVHGLAAPDGTVSCCCSEMLARLAQAGDDTAMLAVREAGGVPLSVQLLAASPSPAQQLHLLTLVTALARGEEGSAQLLQAGLPGVLLYMVASEPMPRTQVKEAALNSLHAISSASPSHFQALRALPGSQDALAAVAAAYGGAWHGSKAALAGLNARLAAAAAADAAAAAAAAAPIAGEMEELVEAP